MLVGKRGAVAVNDRREHRAVPTREAVVSTEWLEGRSGRRKSWCSGEMRRYKEDQRWRRSPAGLQLTRKLKSVRNKQDKIPV